MIKPSIYHGRMAAFSDPAASLPELLRTAAAWAEEHDEFVYYSVDAHPVEGTWILDLRYHEAAPGSYTNSARRLP